MTLDNLQGYPSMRQSIYARQSHVQMTPYMLPLILLYGF
jgi:hypothetical protein